MAQSAGSIYDRDQQADYFGNVEYFADSNHHDPLLGDIEAESEVNTTYDFGSQTFQANGPLMVSDSIMAFDGSNYHESSTQMEYANLFASQGTDYASKEFRDVPNYPSRDGDMDSTIHDHQREPTPTPPSQHEIQSDAVGVDWPSSSENNAALWALMRTELQQRISSIVEPVEGTTEWQCRICQTTPYVSRAGANRHARKHFLSVPCPVPRCSMVQRFSRIDHLRRHFTRIHGNLDRSMCLRGFFELNVGRRLSKAVFDWIDKGQVPIAVPIPGLVQPGT
ncbi:hypothetical protein EDC01DRAFT_635293 [Geopyxis carbonaria]|nr:hypothetical protein EDC01DRAFT_635293 [Geopyxis carbonaria]